MALNLKSKRERCAQCDSAEMTNLVIVEPGEDMQVFVECAACNAFVARYTIKFYTCEDPYRSFLRQMRHRRMASGPALAKASANFSEELWSTYEKAKEMITSGEETSDLEDILDGWGDPGQGS